MRAWSDVVAETRRRRLKQGRERLRIGEK